MTRPILTTLAALALLGSARSSAADLNRQVSEKLFPAAGVKALVVDNRRGSVEVHGSSDGQIHLVAVKEIRGSSSSERRRLDEETQVSAGIDNGTLNVRVTYPSSVSVRLNFFDLFNYDMPRSDVRLTLEVPPSLSVNLHSSSGDLSSNGLSGSQVFESSSGDVEVRDASGPVRTSTSSGDVNARGIAAARMHSSSGDLHIEDARGPLDLEASSGDIEVRGALDSVSISASSGDVSVDRAPRGLRIDTESGEIRVGTASGRVSLETSSGDVQVTLRSPLTRVSIRTESGEIVAHVDDRAGLDLDVGTSSGSIATEVPLKIRNASRHSLTGTVGSGQTPLVMRSSSGDIHLTGGGD